MISSYQDPSRFITSVTSRFFYEIKLDKLSTGYFPSDRARRHFRRKIDFTIDYSFEASIELFFSDGKILPGKNRGISLCPKIRGQMRGIEMSLRQTKPIASLWSKSTSHKLHECKTREYSGYNSRGGWICTCARARVSRTLRKWKLFQFGAKLKLFFFSISKVFIEPKP